MKICIIGAGAMGSLMGFYLSRHADVWLLDPWREHIDAINRDGLLCERDGVIERATLQATTDPAVIGACDTVIILVKAQQTRWAAEHARLVMHIPPSHGWHDAMSKTLVVTLQNGVGNREILAQVLGEQLVGQGVTALGATLLGPGRVRHAGHGPTTWSITPDPKRMQALADLFNTCGLPATLDDNLDGIIWGKLIVNVGINALTALLRVPNGALVDNVYARQLVEEVVAEAVAVAVARGTRLPYSDPLDHVFAVAAATRGNRSSMLQDVIRNSPTEITTINGAVVAEGQRLGVATPANALLVRLVAAIDTTANQRV